MTIDIGLLDPASYSVSVNLMLHALGAVYFFSFGAHLFQIKGLLGSQGILPAHSYLQMLQRRIKKNKYYYVPTVFWLNCSDFMLLLVPAMGTFLGLFLFFDGPPTLLIPLLIILHLSILSVGQDFLGFGWEGFLLELSYHSFFFSLTTVPNLFVWISYNFLVFRFHFEAGTSKLESRDPNWRNLTAIKFHYQSQPLPNTIAWFIHKLPLAFHRFSTFMMFVIELGVPFIALFGNSEMRLISFILFFGLQFFIWATGNFSFLNYLTLVLILPLIANQYLHFIVGSEMPIIAPAFENILLSLVGLSLIITQIIVFWNHYKPTAWARKFISRIYHLHIANRYGIFAVMTTDRYEIIIEGSKDGYTWKEYSFYYKPSELNRRPRRIAPYQPRIDWQAWFLPFGYYEEEIWFQNFLYRILQGSPEVLSLLRHNPFGDNPPRFIRSQLYLYEFTDYKTKKESGLWWKRTYVSAYSPTLQLRKHNEESDGSA